MSRWIRFIIAMIVGAIGGLYYGWAVSPVEYVDTTPDALSIDYKSDYVLMVAEAYSVEDDLPLASRRLALLGGTHPTEVVHQALLFAEPRYNDRDVALIRTLEEALQRWTPALETPIP
jgi:hypothetical protein